MTKSILQIIDREIKAVIFDFDGVVVNSEPQYEKAIEEVFAGQGIRINDDDWQDFKGLSDDEFWEVCQQKYDFKDDLSKIKEQNMTALRENVKSLDYIDGFKDFYNYVSDRYATGLVTSTSSHHLEWLFSNTKIEDLFEYKVTACDIENTKPHPAPYLKMAKMLNVAPENMVVIEDSINGINSANSAGMLTIGLLTSFSADELEMADFTATDYNELDQLFGNPAESD